MTLLKIKKLSIEFSNKREYETMFCFKNSFRWSYCLIGKTRHLRFFPNCHSSNKHDVINDVGTVQIIKKELIKFQ